MNNEAFTCSVCGSTFHSLNQDDDLVCDACGTLSQLTVNESHDADQTFAGVARSGHGGIIGARSAKGDLPTGLQEEKAADRKPPQARDCVAAFQIVLQAHTTAMIHNLGMPVELEDVVERLWFMYLEEWSTKGLYPITFCFIIASGHSSTWMREVQARREPTSKANSFTWAYVKLEERLKIQKGFTSSRVSSANDVGDAEVYTSPDGDVTDPMDANGDDGGLPTVEAEVFTTGDYADEIGGSEGRQETQRGRDPRRGRLTRLAEQGLGGVSDTAFLQRHSWLVFLYVACRQLRLGVLAVHLLQWAESGALPFFNAWSVLPAELQSKVLGVRLFFQPRNIPSVDLIYRGAEDLAAALCIELEEENVPLVARRLIDDMGLPARLFHTVVILFRHAMSELPGSKRSKRTTTKNSWRMWFVDSASDPTYIMCLVLMAARLDRRWESWALEERKGGRGEADRLIVESLESLASLRRGELKAYLNNVKDVVFSNQLNKEPVTGEAHSSFLDDLAAALPTDSGTDDAPAKEGSRDFGWPLLREPPIPRSPTRAPQKVYGVQTEDTLPYCVYDMEDEPGLLPDHLWALVEMGAAVLKMSTTALVHQMCEVDKVMNGSKTQPKVTGRWWSAEFSRTLKAARREGLQREARASLDGLGDTFGGGVDEYDVAQIDEHMVIGDLPRSE